MSVASNNKKIQGAFKAAVANANKSMENGLVALLNAGVAYCLGEHDGGHQAHLNQVGDSYGWILTHNGKEISRAVWGSGAAKGNADKMLSAVIGKANKDGWDGFILAGMQPATYFSLRYEFMVMRRGIADIKAEDFKTYFKPV